MVKLGFAEGFEGGKGSSITDQLVVGILSVWGSVEESTKVGVREID